MASVAARATFQAAFAVVTCVYAWAKSSSLTASTSRNMSSTHCELFVHESQHYAVRSETDHTPRKAQQLPVTNSQVAQRQLGCETVAAGTVN